MSSANKREPWKQHDENYPIEVKVDQPTNDDVKVAEVVSSVKIGKWNKLQRGIPKEFTLCPLFRIRKRGSKRCKFEKEVLFTSHGVEPFTIIYSGEELGQDDCDYFLEFINHCKEEQSDSFRVTQREFFRKMGRAGGKSGRESLDGHLNRMQRAQLMMIRGKEKKVTSLILRYDIDEEGVAGQLDNRILAFFKYTVYLGHSVRSKLRGDLAKWLHAHISGHKSSLADPNRIKLCDIQELCGSTANKEIFKRDVKKAMQQLMDLGIVGDWALEHKGTVLRYAKSKNANEK